MRSVIGLAIATVLCGSGWSAATAPARLLSGQAVQNVSPTRAGYEMAPNWKSVSPGAGHEVQTSAIAAVAALGRTSNRCVTPKSYCYLEAPAPIGTPCWCATPYGPAAGQVR